MGETDAPPVRTSTVPSASRPVPTARMRPQRGASSARYAQSSASLARLREEVAMLSLLVADQNRLLSEIAAHIGRRLDVIEGAIEVRAGPILSPIERFQLQSHAPREATVRRFGLGRGLDALIPSRDSNRPT